MLASFLSRYWRPEAIDALCEGLAASPSVSIRLNPARMDTLLAGRDAASVIEGFDGHVPWCPEGVYLSTRPAFTADPLFHAGGYYVQEASSMFLAHVLRELRMDNGECGMKKCLDFCAAPGGKSTILRSILPTDCLLVANEPDRRRSQVLAENLSKWGAPNTIVTNSSQIEGGPFSLILTDVPCSGEGMFRKEEEARRQWSPDLVACCAALQRDIAARAWDALAPDGILIYSTCTFNPEEDENNILWITHHLGAEIVDIPIQQAWGISRYTDIALPERLEALGPDDRRTLHSCYHFIPGRVRGEGFFIAVMRKAKTVGGEECALRSFPQVSSSLTLGDGAGVALSLSDAIRYLRGESLTLPPDTPLGVVNVGFRGQLLGSMKNIGSRANNLYPKEWRIRSTHIEPHTIFIE